MSTREKPGVKSARSPVYRPADAPVDYPKDLGDPGQPPYTRGIYPTMYRGRRWTMRQYAGFGSAQQTNERFHYLLKAGQTGLSVAFDLPTQMGYDSDHPRAAARSAASASRSRRWRTWRCCSTDCRSTRSRRR